MEELREVSSVELGVVLFLYFHQRCLAILSSLFSLLLSSLFFLLASLVAFLLFALSLLSILLSVCSDTAPSAI